MQSEGQAMGPEKWQRGTYRECISEKYISTTECRYEGISSAGPHDDFMYSILRCLVLLLYFIWKI